MGKYVNVCGRRPRCDQKGRRSEMKTLEQLGISLAPWRQVANGYGTLDVLGSDDSLVVAYENPINNNDQENRRLIAAAPDLYEALYDVVAYCESTHLVPSERFGKVLARAKAALAKASLGSEEEE